jgi:hypothetical protein
MMLRRRTLLLGTLTAGPALAQTADWPQKPIRLVVPGGLTDSLPGCWRHR